MSYEDTMAAVKEGFESATFDRPIEDIVGTANTRRRRRTTVVGGAAALAIALFVVAVAPFGTPNSAFAGWTPEPYAAGPAVLADAGPSCTTMLNAQAALHPEVGRSDVFDTLGWSDLRGNGLVLVYPSGKLLGICTFVDIGNGFGGDGDAFILTESDLEADLGGPLQVNGVGSLVVEGSGATLVIGQVDPSITGITVSAPGWNVEASTYKGSWLAWWPANSDDILVKGFNNDGELLDEWRSDHRS